MRCLFALLLLLTTTPAAAAVEMAFYSHELTGSVTKVVDFPHAFVTVRGRPDAGGRAVDTNWGFTASRISPAILIGPVNGKMVAAGRAYVRNSRRHLALSLSDAQYAAAVTAYRSWAAVRGKSYDLDTRNCVHFVREMARAVGLAVPADATLTKQPAAYLEAVAARNPR